MSMFTIAISYLTTSNLPWFMDLTFQVPMQYCTLQLWTLLPPPVTSTTGCCFCFGSVSTFFMELFLHWSPVAYWAPTDLAMVSGGCVALEWWAAKRVYPTFKVRSNACALLEQPWRDTPCPRSGAAAVLCWTGHEEIPPRPSSEKPQ